MNNLQTRLANLLSVKSLVTLTLTGVFAALSVAGRMSQEFMTIYTVVITFYFGTQAAKKEAPPTNETIITAKDVTDVKATTHSTPPTSTDAQ